MAVAATVIFGIIFLMLLVIIGYRRYKAFHDKDY